MLPGVHRLATAGVVDCGPEQSLIHATVIRWKIETQLGWSESAESEIIVSEYKWLFSAIGLDCSLILQLDVIHWLTVIYYMWNLKSWLIFVSWSSRAWVEGLTLLLIYNRTVHICPDSLSGIAQKELKATNKSQSLKMVTD